MKTQLSWDKHTNMVGFKITDGFVAQFGESVINTHLRKVVSAGMGLSINGYKSDC
jgi:hypothetical protein